MDKTCRSCKRKYPLTSAYFYSNGFTPSGARKWKPTCKDCENTERKSGLDDILLEHFGEIKCSNCGYDKHKSVIDCHHVDPSEKEYSVAKFRSSRRNIDVMRKELAKCILLCANCHRETHLGLI